MPGRRGNNNQTKSSASWVLFAWTVLLLIPQASQAQEPTVTDERPTAYAVRIDNVDAPKIDGDLNDPIWKKAKVISDFKQVIPVQGAAPSHETRAYILYDDKNLYVGMYAYDDPDKIVATIQERDGAIFKEDYLRIYLDSHDTKRDSFGFEMNALGARTDVLTENNARVNVPWDTIWRGKSKVHDDGWSVEFEIPFQSISYDPDAESLGLEINRQIVRNNESIRWSAINQSIRNNDVSQAGRLKGIEGLDKGIGIDAQGFVTGRWQRHWPQPGREDDLTIQPSGNIYYKMTPSMTGTLTLNTDFTDAPLDARQVNVTRFDLFFPEQRDFFLQDASVFEFGGRIFDRGKVNGRPFFSRRVGFVGNDPVDILAGAKVSGGVGPVNIGAFTTLTGEHDTAHSQVLSVLRASADIWDESRVGMLYTNGDPTGAIENNVIGADFQYRTSKFLGNKVFQTDLMFLQSISSTSDATDQSFGVEFAYPQDGLFLLGGFHQVGEGFDPRLGFVIRQGTRRYSTTGGFRKRWSTGPIQFVEGGWRIDAFTDLNDELLTSVIRMGGGPRTRAGDQYTLRFKDTVENIRGAFPLPTGVILPVGKYHWQTGGFKIESFNGRPYSFVAEVECCDWFAGSRLNVIGKVELRPSRFFTFKGEHEFRRIKLPTGDFDVHITQIEANLNFTPDMQLASQIQYDNVSDELSYLGRFRWQIQPVTELFIALEHTAFTDFDQWTQDLTGTSIRFGHTLRY
jgi:hypothetical protein